VPSETVYVVLDDFGKLGRAYRETGENEADLESVIDDFLTGQFSKPVRVIAFNAVEGWARDVSEDVALEIMKRSISQGECLTGGVREFATFHLVESKTTDQLREYATACEAKAREVPTLAPGYKAFAQGWREVADTFDQLEKPD